MTRAVFDTVTLVRGLITPFGWSGRLFFDHAADYEMVVSPAIVAEYLEVLGRPRRARKFPKAGTRDLHAVLNLIRLATVVFPIAVPAVSRDSTDDKFLAAAKKGNAECIVTADNDLLDIGTYEQIAIVTAETFLMSLDL